MKHHKMNRLLASLLGLSMAAAIFTGCAAAPAAAPTAEAKTGAVATATIAAPVESAPVESTAPEEAIYESAETTAETYNAAAVPGAASCKAAASAAEMYMTDTIEAEAYMADACYPEEELYVELPAFNTEEYSYTEENRFLSPAAAPFSTFAADVDTASYANFRRQVLAGGSVVPDSVRIEEMINYFHYDYPDPERGEPFSVTTELSDCPWNDEAKLLMIGLSAQQFDEKNFPSRTWFS